MGIPSASYSITMRVHLGADPLGIGRITTAVGESAGTVVAVDIVESHPDLLVVDLTCNAVDARHADAITQAVGGIDGADVHAVSDRTFLLHLGGKLEVTSKVPLRTRDDLSMAYTPGVARQTGQASTPANCLNSRALPSMTGRAASGPMLPRPSTAEPSVTTATVLRLMVSLRASAGLAAIARQTLATPGV